MTSPRQTGVPSKGGDEYDAFSRRARRLLCYLKRAGVTKKIKVGYNRRVRRAEVEDDS